MRLALLGTTLTLLAACSGGKTACDSPSVDTTASDSQADSQPGDSGTGDSVTNQPPAAFDVAISPAAPTDRDDLICNIVTPSTDPEGVAITYAYTWVVNGLDGGVTTDTVPAASTTVGDVWTCGVTASDGVNTTEAVSAAVTILVAPCLNGETETLGGASYVHVCASTFDMGCTAGAGTCGPFGETVHTVTLSADRWVGQYEVTQAEFSAVMGYNPSFAVDDSYPVENLTFSEGAAYANALSAADALDACYTCAGSGSTVACEPVADPYACGGYRFLTEAEWEGAARCGEDLEWSGSATADDVAWTQDFGATSEETVGLLAPNACNLYDMSGNVWEWTGDWYGTITTDPVTDPVGADTGTIRTIRGGDWSHYPSYARVAYRASLDPTLKQTMLGIRLSRR